MINEAGKVRVKDYLPEPQSEFIVMSEEVQSSGSVFFLMVILVVLESQNLHDRFRYFLLFRLLVLGLSGVEWLILAVFILESFFIVVVNGTVWVDGNLVVFEHETV